jgi:DNA-binding CsgD family transcriptional regulator
VKSKRITEQDLQNIFTLLGECRELGDDYGQWRTHVMQGLARLVDAELIMHAAMTGIDERRNCMHSGSAWGFQNGFNLAGWIELAKNYGPDFSVTVLQMLTRIRASSESGLTLARQSIIPTKQWESSFDCQIVSRTIGTDAVMQSFHWANGRRQVLDSMTLGRGIGSRLFNEREEALVQLAHSQIAKLIGGPLAGHQEPQPSQLPLRVRQVLRCLLEGDGDKQIARRLRLSIYTVNQYTKHIFKFFQVSSRAELLARWIKRGWQLNTNDWQQHPATVGY